MISRSYYSPVTSSPCNRAGDIVNNIAFSTIKPNGYNTTLGRDNKVIFYVYILCSLFWRNDKNDRKAAMRKIDEREHYSVNVV